MRATSSPDPGGAFRASARGALAAVRVQPRSRPEGLEGFVADAAGAVRLKVRLGAAPEDGKANAALLRLLAREWGVAPARLALVGGATARNKIVLLAGDPAEALDWLRAWAGKEAT